MSDEQGRIFRIVKIGIDARFAVHNRRGIGNYTLELICNLAELDNKNNYILYIDTNDKENILPKRENFRISQLAPRNYAIWEQYVLPKQAKIDGIDLLHCTGNTSPIYLDKSIKLVTTIHDVMFLKDNQVLAQSESLYQRCGRFYRKTIVSRAISRANKIITISGFSKDDIKKHISNLNDIDIDVIYESCASRFCILNKEDAMEAIASEFGIEDKYFLTLGAIDPRKNTELILNTFIALKEAGRIKEKLVVVGLPNWKQTKYHKIVQLSKCSGEVVFTNFINEDDLVKLYNGAIAFLYPSLYEGFGLPPLEAMACGTPVITSNTTSIPEIVGNAALLIDPTNGEELSGAIVKLSGDNTLRVELIQKGFLQVAKYSWRKMAQETLQLYENLLSDGNV